jgi:hypothetical protein
VPGNSNRQLSIYVRLNCVLYEEMIEKAGIFYRVYPLNVNRLSAPRSIHGKSNVLLSPVQAAVVSSNYSDTYKVADEDY